MFNPEISFAEPKDQKSELKKNIEAYLTLPEKINAGNELHDVPKHLGNFLVDQGYIQGVDIWRGSWGCKYENKKIYINDRQMPAAAYDYYVFRLGKNSASGCELFPKSGEEVDQYRFLHETNHAYQNYLQAAECPDDPSMWYTKALGNIN